jgi:hypothetical protein
MSKEAEEFFRQKTIENAKRPRMKKFLALVNREAEGKILQEYADKQLRLYDVSQHRKLLIEAFDLINIHDGDREKITKLVDITLKSINCG